jgi:hypothetical protein
LRRFCRQSFPLIDDCCIPLRQKDKGVYTNRPITISKAASQRGEGVGHLSEGVGMIGFSPGNHSSERLGGWLAPKGTAQIGPINLEPTKLGFISHLMD